VFWRKWLVRGLVFSVLAAMLAAAYVYQRWTNPEAVRLQVIAKLHDLFPGAEITLDSARLRLFGGIALSELRLTRSDDPDKTDFAYFPSALLYHDKEQLLEGKLFIRKVELNRPRLHIVRNREGYWNLSGLMAPLKPHEQPQIPTVVIHQGTILLEDQLANPGQLPIEIGDVNLTLVNDPLPTVTMEGTARSALASSIQVRGTWQREGNEVKLSARVDDIAVGPPLVQRLAAYYPDVGEHGRYLEGVGKLQAELFYRPESQPAFSHDVHCQLSQGKLRDPSLPLPFDQLEVAVRCTDSHLVVKRFSARAGEAALNLTQGDIRWGSGAQGFAFKGTIAHLPIAKDLFVRLPDGVRVMDDLFKPEGPATLSFDVAQQAGAWKRQAFVLRPEGIKAAFKGFDYLLERITGTVDIDWLQKHITVELAGYTGPRRVQARGDWLGLGAQARVNLDIQGQDVPLDQKLMNALCEPFKTTVRAFRLGGLGDFQIKIRHTPGTKEFANQYLVLVHDGSMEWEQFPYRLEQVKGILDIQPRHWEFRDFQGTHQNGVLRARGRSYPVPEGQSRLDPRIAVEINGTNVLLDKDMRRAIGKFEGLARAWDNFDPKGRLDFSAKIDHLPKQPQDLDVTVNVCHCSINPCFFRYALNDLSGQVHYSKNGVQLRQVSARHNNSVVQLARGDVKLYPGGSYVKLSDGKVNVYPNGLIYVDLPDLQANPLVPDAEFRNALPPALKQACEGMHLKDPVAFQTRLVIALAGEPGSLPQIFWDGKLWMRGATIQAGVPIEQVSGCFGCTGSHNGHQMEGLSGNLQLTRATMFNQPFQDVYCTINVPKKTPDVMVLGVNAPLFGGKISGQARVEVNSTLRYDMDLTASEVKLDAFGRHNFGSGSQLSGVVGGRLFLTGKGNGLSSLEGNGSLEIPKGHLYNLPLLLDLLKFLGLRWPDRTAFDQAQATFSIHGDVVSFSQLELYGNAISLHGQGEMKLDGSDVRLDFIPVWGRIEQLLPSVWQPIPSVIGKNVLKIEMRGKVGKEKDLHFHKKPLPALTNPLLQIRDRILGKPGENSAPGNGTAN
jgi:hypothetical protein